MYAIQVGDDGPIKFGVAASPESRRKELQVGSPWKLNEIGAIQSVDCKFIERLERLAHRGFRSARMMGEWFSPAVEKAA